MNLLHHTIVVVVALRWPLVAIAFVLLGALYADALHVSHRRLTDNRKLAQRVDQLETSNRALLTQLRSRRTARRPIIAGRVVR